MLPTRVPAGGAPLSPPGGPEGATTVDRAKLALSLAGLDLSLELTGVLPAGLLAELRRHPGPAGAPALRLRLSLHAGLPPSFDPLALRRDGSSFACTGDGLWGTVDEHEARLDVFGGLAAVGSALRLVCALWLAPRGGLLLHGACVRLPGAALGLCGPSGAGKTTLSGRLFARGLSVLSDEVVALRGPRAFGHPFPRKLGDGLAPEGGLALRALGFLSHAGQGRGPAVTRLLAPQAARALLARVFMPLKDARLLGSLLDSAELLARAVPAYALDLPDDERAADAALSLLGGAP